MIDEARVATLTGATVYGTDGDKIGKVDAVYLDDTTNRPEWIAVKTGLFGSNVSFVPLDGADADGDDVRVPYDKAMVKNAPNFGADAHLSEQEESELYAYYGREYGGYDADGVGTTTGMTTDTTADATTDTTSGMTTDTTAGAVGRDTSGPTTDDAMTRSEERMRVGTERVETGRARLRKHVVTENVTQTVPVRREEVRVEREPITEGNVGAATDGPAISEEEHEVTLTEERPVVAKETVPVERVRLTKDEHVGEETVSGDVRKEQIDTDDVYPSDAATSESSRQTH
jgi:uncharacterized protein (TIGR02271 family)